MATTPISVLATTPMTHVMTQGQVGQLHPNQIQYQQGNFLLKIFWGF